MMHEIMIYRKADVIRLIKNLLPLSKHSEKIRKMYFILENKNKPYSEIEKPWNKLKEEITRELLRNR